MANFGENFRNNRGPVLCPFCETHLDNQALSLQCTEVKKQITIKTDITDIYTQNISLESIKTITKISEIREDFEVDSIA